MSAIDALCSQRGIENKENSDGPAEANRNPDVDKVVHEIAKLFGHLGTPEYCHGAQSFQIFLALKARERKGADKTYYENAQKVFLKRQVGSCYYVTHIMPAAFSFSERQ